MDRIAIGMMRLGIVIMVGTIAAICWFDARPQYAQMQSQIFAISLDRDAAWSGDFGTPVYYGPEPQPQELRLNIDASGFAFVAEPKIKNDEAVNCLRKYPSAAVHVVDRPPPSLAEVLSANSSASPLPQHFVLFDSEKTAKAVVVATSPTTVDFQAIHPEPRLDACITGAYMKAAAQTDDRIAKIRQDFYLTSAILLAEVLLGELALFLVVYWVLRGFFGTGKAA